MLQRIFIFLLFFVSFFSQSQKVKPNFDETKFVYITPSAISGGIVSLDNIWLQAGYGIANGRKMASIDLGTIIYSPKSKGDGSIFSNLSQVKSNGILLSGEYKYFLKPRLFCATNFYYRFMKTTREEIVFIDLYSPEVHNEYNVLRNEIGFVPTIGFAIYQKERLSCDLALGAGIRFISSSSKGKMNTNVFNGTEYFARKLFDEGNKFAQRIIFQLKVGYVF